MKIEYSKQAAKFISKQDKPTRQRLQQAIENLPNGDVKKLQGQPFYRLRVGDFRVFFNVSGQVVFVSKIGNRGQIYK